MKLRNKLRRLKINKSVQNMALMSYLIIFLLTMILFGKLWVALSGGSSFLTYAYGLIVTSVILTIFIITFSKYKDPYFEALKTPGFKQKNYKVSCMVAVKNEEGLIGQCVQSFVSQSYKNREIIFVNDASTDNTGKILDTFAKKGLIKVIHLKKNVGKKKALARAMSEAKGEIFLFSDSDSVLAPEAMKKIVTIFSSDKNIGAVSGHCRALNGNKNLLTKIQDTWYEGQFSIRKAFESIYGSITCVSGPLAAFRKETIYNFIPAWENDSFLGEEFKFATDRTLTGFVLGNKVLGPEIKKKYADSPFVSEIDYPNKDWSIVYSKSTRAFTNVPDDFKTFFKQQVRWKKSFIRNIFFTGSFYWRKPFLPALFYYLHILFVLVGPLIVFLHLVYLPFSGNSFAAPLYLFGIIFIGFSFGLAYKMENKNDDKWIYRPLMSLISTLLLSWLLFYSALTIKNQEWFRG